MTITINYYRKFTIGAFLRLWLPIFAMLGIGVWTGSSAMQWFGFCLAFVFMIGVSFNEARKNQSLTIDQARKRLDELEGAAEWNG